MTAAVVVPSSLKVLLVDDNPDDLARFRRLVRGLDWEVVSASSGAECLERVPLAEPDVIILDYNLGDSLGTDILARLRGMGIQTPAIVQSGIPGALNAIGGLPSGASGFVSKNSTEYSREIIDMIRATAAPRPSKASVAGLDSFWSRVDAILGGLVDPAPAGFTCAGVALERGPLISAHFAMSRDATNESLEALARLAKAGPALTPSLRQTKANFMVLDFEGTRACVAPVPGVGTLFAASDDAASPEGCDAFRSAVEDLGELDTSAARAPPGP